MTIGVTNLLQQPSFLAHLTIRYDSVYLTCSTVVMGYIKFALYAFVCLSVCLGRISYIKAERIWLTFCTRTKVCPGRCVSH